MRIPRTSKCNCYIVYCRRSRETRTYRRRQLFPSTCRIHIRIRNEICMRRKKKLYERAVLSKRTRSFCIDSRPSFVTHATLATTRTTHVAFRTNLYLQHLLGAASRTQYNAHMRICVNAGAIAAQLHTSIAPTSRGGSGSVRKANRAYHFPARKCRLHSSARR